MVSAGFELELALADPCEVAPAASFKAAIPSGHRASVAAAAGTLEHETTSCAAGRSKDAVPPCAAREVAIVDEAATACHMWVRRDAFGGHVGRRTWVGRERRGRPFVDVAREVENAERACTFRK